MSGFDYIRSMRSYYKPRTPRAAIVAAEAALLPVDAIVFKGSSVKPLFEEPYDLDELERILAQRDLSFADAMMLSEIFQTMTRDRDKERALFAAESLTMLENRYASRVEALRAEAEGEVEGKAEESPGESPPEDGEATAFALARALYEEAMISGRIAPIRNYYLREAYYALARRAWGDMARKAFNLRIRCLLGLGLVDQAEFELGMSAGTAAADPERAALAAEAAYHARDTRRLREVIEGLDADAAGFSAELAEALGAWKS